LHVHVRLGKKRMDDVEEVHSVSSYARISD